MHGKHAHFVGSPPKSDMFTLLIFRHILHDPELYDDPLKFDPERFIKDGKIDKAVPNPYSAAFGFGRR